MKSMNEYTVEFSPETQEQLQRGFEIIADACKQFVDMFYELALQVLETIRRVGIELSRWFVAQQLIEWRVPAKIAVFIAKHFYWRWSLRLGFAWFHRKLLL